jgi:hypothetical protein
MDALSHANLALSVQDGKAWLRIVCRMKILL